MRLLPALKALGSVFLLLADGFPVVEEDFPEIIGPKCVRVNVLPGEELVLHCDALANCAEGEAMIYWLVNGSFPEDTTSADRIIESNENSIDDGAIVQRSLLLKNVTAEDFNSTFKCIVTNAVGMAQKRITLHAMTSDCSLG